MVQEHQEKATLNKAGKSVELDVQGLALTIFEATGTFVGTVIFEYTINGTDWYTLNTYTTDTTILATSATTTGKWFANVAGYLKVRVRCSAYTSGSILIFIRANLTGGQSLTGNLDANGNQQVTLATLLAGEDLVNNVLKVEQRFSNFNINTATTTTVKSGAGYIDEILIVGGTLGNVTVYDSLVGSGTVLCPTVTPIANGIILKHCIFSTGFTIVTAAATVITGSYR